MLKNNELKKIKVKALQAAHEAGEVLMRYYRKKLDVKEKEAAGLVTQADVNSEKLIKKILQKAYPDFVFLGEESGLSSSVENMPMWHVDPLDGTTNFVHGFPLFCVSIGLAIGDTPLLGVVHIPTLGETIHGHIGGGVYLNKKKVRASSRKNISEALFTTGFSYLHEEQKLAAEVARFQKVSLAARAVRRPGAAAIDLAYVAAGIFDGFWEKNLSSWDVCAGAALVKEAGGKVSNYQGQDMVFSRKEILATNSHLHLPMMEILK